MEPPLKSPAEALDGPGVGKDTPLPPQTLDLGLEKQAPEPENWRGAACPRCGRETFRLLPYGYTGKRRACPRCIEGKRRLMDYRARVIGHRRAR